jgi:predicted dienelactone hydrolase
MVANAADGIQSTGNHRKLDRKRALSYFRRLFMVGNWRVHLWALCAASLIALPGSAEARRFAVGLTTLDFAKTSVSTGAPRPLPTLVWYPAKAGTGTAEEFGLRDATVHRGRFPLVLFSHGSCGHPDEATYLTMALASRGFVVAAPPHPGNTAAEFPSCLATANFVDSFLNRVPDIRFVLDAMLAEHASTTSRFGGHLRPDAIGMSGLSYGGFTTLFAAQQEPRITAALALVPGGSGALQATPITIPTMVIGAERDRVVLYVEAERAFAKLSGPRFLIELVGANHLSAVDDCVSRFTGINLCVAADISQEDAHRLVLRYAVPFMRRYVAGARAGKRALVRKTDGVILTAEPRGPAEARE